MAMDISLVRIYPLLASFFLSLSLSFSVPCSVPTLLSFHNVFYRSTFCQLLCGWWRGSLTLSLLLLLDVAGVFLTLRDIHHKQSYVFTMDCVVCRCCETHSPCITSPFLFLTRDSSLYPISPISSEREAPYTPGDFSGF
ncbi:hypothetical protein BDF14DRAFT_53208 [Spinellus fusiger]|nr:hypothetical protein BDF14DRAFT_53208 [Spinellus fusiger]